MTEDKLHKVALLIKSLLSGSENDSEKEESTSEEEDMSEVESEDEEDMSCGNGKIHMAMMRMKGMK